MRAVGRRRGRIAVKFRARLLPIESAERQQAAYFAVRVGYQLFVAQIVNASGQGRLPVRHEPAVGDVVASDLGEIVGKWIAVVEKRFVHRVARGQRLAGDVDDLRARQRSMEQTAVEEVDRHLVDEEPLRAACGLAPRQILAPECCGIDLRRPARDFGGRQVVPAGPPAGGLADQAGQMRQLLRRDDLGVAG